MQRIPTPPGWWHSKESEMSEALMISVLRKLLRMRHAYPAARYEAARAVGAIRLIRCLVA